MSDNLTQELNSLPTEELEAIVHKGENLHIPTSRASQAQRILESRRHAELIVETQKPIQKEELPSPTDLTIFYSWQSDLPNKTNRTLIEEALKLAIKNTGQDSSIKIIPRLDKDTAGVPGSPNIATTILDKIDRSFLTVSDVSITNSGYKSRQTPNPNVLYELGYAVKSLGMSNVIMVQNTAYGGPEKLPFDLKLHRVLTYRCDPNGNTAEVRKNLASSLEHAIKLALSNVEASTYPSLSVVDDIQNLLASNQPVLALEAKLKPIVDQAKKDLSQTDLYKYNSAATAEEFKTRKLKVEEILKDLMSIYFHLGRWTNNTYIGTIVRQFERIASVPTPDGTYHETWVNLAHYPGLLLMYSLGLGAIYNENISALDTLLKVKSYNRFTGEDEPIWVKTSVFGVFRYYKDIIKEEKRYFPGSDDLFELFKPFFEDVSTEKYEDIFDSFEYILTLKYGVQSMNKGEGRFWVPTGSYMWRKRRRKIWEVLVNELNKDGEGWIYFNCMRVNIHDLKRAIHATNEFVVKHSAGMW